MIESHIPVLCVKQNHRDAEDDLELHPNLLTTKILTQQVMMRPPTRNQELNETLNQELPVPPVKE